MSAQLGLDYESCGCTVWASMYNCNQFAEALRTALESRPHSDSLNGRSCLTTALLSAWEKHTLISVASVRWGRYGNETAEEPCHMVSCFQQNTDVTSRIFLYLPRSTWTRWLSADACRLHRADIQSFERRILTKLLILWVQVMQANGGTTGVYCTNQWTDHIILSHRVLTKSELQRLVSVIHLDEIIFTLRCQVSRIVQAVKPEHVFVW